METWGRSCMFVVSRLKLKLLVLSLHDLLFVFRSAWVMPGSWQLYLQGIHFEYIWWGHSQAGQFNDPSGNLPHAEWIPSCSAHAKPGHFEMPSRQSPSFAPSLQALWNCILPRGLFLLWVSAGWGCHYRKHSLTLSSWQRCLHRSYRWLKDHASMHIFPICCPHWSILQLGELSTYTALWSHLQRRTRIVEKSKCTLKCLWRGPLQAILNQKGQPIDFNQPLGKPPLALKYSYAGTWEVLQWSGTIGLCKASDSHLPVLLRWFTSYLTMPLNAAIN